MQGIATQSRGIARLARVLGLDGNPLRRASDRAEAWIRAGLVAIFLIVGPLAALHVGRLAYRSEITGAPAQAAPTHLDKAVVLHPAHVTADPARANGSTAGGTGTRWEDARASARGDAALAGVTTLALVALALLAALRLAVTFLNRLRLAAWERAWSRVGPQWTRRRF